MIAQALAGLATVLAAVFLLPQIHRLVVRRDASGVSAVWAVFGVVTNAAWVGYLSLQGRWVPTIAPALAVASYGVVLAVVIRIGGGRRWVPWSAAYVLSFVAASAAGGRWAVGLLLALSPAIQLAPEIAAVYRKPDPSGVAPTTWGLATAEALCWGGYGWLAGDGALVGYGVITSVGAMLVLGRWWVRCGLRWNLATAT